MEQLEGNQRKKEYSFLHVVMLQAVGGNTADC